MQLEFSLSLVTIYRLNLLNLASQGQNLWILMQFMFLFSLVVVKKINLLDFESQGQTIYGY